MKGYRGNAMVKTAVKHILAEQRMDLVLQVNDLQKEVISGCIAGDRLSQKALYEHFYSKMLSVCHRYAKDYDEAVGLLNEGFVKVFCNIAKYRPERSLESWIKRIMINNAIDHYRKMKKHRHQMDITEVYDHGKEGDILPSLEAEEILKLVQQLPPAYRTVFNLFAIDGLSHKEIAKQLGISEGTSKSNLSKARAKLKIKLQILYRENEK